MKKALTILALSAIAVLGTRQIVLSQFGPLSEFTATLLVDRFGDDGVYVDSHVETIAIRKDGAIAQTQTFGQNGPDDTHVIYDPANLERIVLDSRTKSKGTFGSPSEPLKPGERRSPLPETCGPKEGSQSKKFAGFQAYSFESCSENCATKTVAWKSPRLGCLTIAVQTYRNDVLIHKRELSSLVAGPPDEALFTISDDYVERSPREYAAEKARGRGPGFIPKQAVVDAAEARYLGGKRNKK